MIHLGDVTKIDGAVAPLVDVIIGGSPCQDLSVAGKRAGLDGARSGLFMEQIRIIKEMRRRCENAGANEIRPRYFVWENVPGAFSSNGGEDFRTVLEEICRIVDERAHVPRPHTGGGTLWRTSGAIMGDGYSVAWRVLDAQFWGVPQRRRRIALVADFGGATAPEILFVAKSLSGGTQAGRATRQGTPSDLEGSAGTPIGFDYLQGSDSRGIGAEADRCGTIRVQPHIAVCHEKPIGFNYTNSITAKTNPTIDKAEALRASGGGGAAVCYALDRASFNQGANAQYNPSITDDGVSQTIVAKGPGAVCIKPSGAEVYDARGNGNGETVPTITGDHNDRITDYTAVVCYDLTRRDVAREYGDQSPTLLGFRGSGGGNTPVVASRPTYCLQGNGIDRSETAGCNGKGIKEGVCYTLNTIDRPAVSDGAEGYIVRRLTPLECERLQGFPDGWTDIGEWIDEKGKTRQTTDAVRYKALGNSIAIPPWKWVLKRLCAYYERDATMASLFDGIGGFPLIWEQLNGCGSCLWASEIEEFPLAVTKKHFQGVTA